jgi:hypothetical protein
MSSLDSWYVLTIAFKTLASLGILPRGQANQRSTAGPQFAWHRWEEHMNKWVFCILLAITIFLLLAVTAGSSGGIADRRGDIMGYNVMAERVFEGTVQDKPYLMGEMLYVPLMTADSVFRVQIGPKKFVERSGFKVRVGETLTVTGMPVLMKGQNIVLAREVRSVSAVLTVRDGVGLPLWESDKPIQMDPERQQQPLEICRMIN